jgi:hypothetical protein
MKSVRRGKHTSDVEVTNVSRHGVWILLQQRELFLPFETFPWFCDAPIAKILRIELPSPGHLYWPELDIDLAVESIERPERFPLVSRVQPERARRLAGRRAVRRVTPGTRPSKAR